MRTIPHTGPCTAGQPIDTCTHRCAPHRHGTERGHACGCRGEHCRAANAAKQRRLQRRRAYSAVNPTVVPPIWTSPVGTWRRIQALRADGWPLPILGDRLGITDAAVYLLTEDRYGARRMRWETAKRVRDLYEQLAQETPPDTAASTYARNRARKHGWAESWRWDGIDIDDPDAQPAPLNEPTIIDWVIVQRAIDGRHPTMTRAERVEAMRRLAEMGYNGTVIADRLGLARKSVSTMMRRLGIPLSQQPSSGAARNAA